MYTLRFPFELPEPYSMKDEYQFEVDRLRVTLSEREDLQVLKVVGFDSEQAAISATRRVSSSALRKRVGALARRRFGEGRALIYLENFLKRCERLTDRRNQLTPNIMAEGIDEAEDEPGLFRVLDSGEMKILNDDLEWVAAPSASEVRELAVEIEHTADDMHNVRLNGWMAEALRTTAKVKM